MDSWLQLERDGDIKAVFFYAVRPYQIEKYSGKQPIA